MPDWTQTQKKHSTKSSTDNIISVIPESIATLLEYPFIRKPFRRFFYKNSDVFIEKNSFVSFNASIFNLNEHEFWSFGYLRRLAWPYACRTAIKGKPGGLQHSILHEKIFLITSASEIISLLRNRFSANELYHFLLQADQFWRFYW